MKRYKAVEYRAVVEWWNESCFGREFHLTPLDGSAAFDRIPTPEGGRKVLLIGKDGEGWECTDEVHPRITWVPGEVETIREEEG